jgi:hypothetical protein
LILFNAEGRKLCELAECSQKMGEYSIVWDGKTEKGEILAAGLYYYQLKIGDFISSKKMVMLK